MKSSEVEILLLSKERWSHTPTTDVSAWLVSLRNNYLELLLVLITIFLNFCKISRKLSITESDNSNVAGATLLKSLSAVDILLPILQEFRNIFSKEHLRKADGATFTCFNVMTLNSSSHQKCSIKIAILKNSATFTGRHCWSLFWIKLQVWRSATLLKRDSNPGIFL